MFFEGSEKKVEVVIKSDKSLRSLGKDYWEKIVKSCQATILSTISNDHIDAYLLSESSLFVWKDRFVMITCGRTVLQNSVTEFIKDFGSEDIDSIIFQRKNEYNSRDQITSFEEDLKAINSLVPGKAIRMGYLDGHHMHLYHMDKCFTPVDGDTTSELLMYHIENKAGDVLRSENQTIEDIQNLLKLKTVFPEFIFDDFLFTPFGYSMNGIYEDKYITMHITPQEDSSYVSFETNLNLEKSHQGVLNHFLEVFEPGSYDLINFNTVCGEEGLNNYLCASAFETKLDCGYDLTFSQFIKDNKKRHQALSLEL